MERLQKLKLVLGIQGSDEDDLLNYLLETTEQKILNYCNIKELPEELEDVLVDMTADVYRFRQRDMGEGRVSQINVGDTAISYSDSGNFNIMTGAGGADFLKNYKAQLNRFRRMKLA